MKKIISVVLVMSILFLSGCSINSKSQKIQQIQIKMGKMLWQRIML
ncbi:hypothetical protein PL321_06050 [Caloramator sp. mosi_1]|nr:hypothetical protein [Caloramator sp. mosi_1]WDC85076.1 hypothetical protein PL321_06050 [Caloramator sp. mosi_1]